jgi:polyhydroxybutyrate depolymerase
LEFERDGPGALKVRKIVIGAVLLVIGLPVVLILIAVAAFYAIFYFPNRTSAASGTIVSSGVQREYLLYAPKSYKRAKPTPLVISLHPAMSWPTSQMHFSQWNRMADEHGFIVVYPAGEGGGPKTWFMRGRRTPSRMPDVIFISELIDTLEASYNIDPTRIYADGLSNGGGMAFVLSCTLSDRIAAVGMVSAARSPDWNWCDNDRPVPMIAFHGTADRIAPYNGGRTPVGSDIFPSVPSFTANWARRNRCGQHPIESAAAADVTRLEYTDCANDAAVVLYTVRGGGHQWPGGRPIPEWLVGPFSRSVDATSQMWAFFREHQLLRNDKTE